MKKNREAYNTRGCRETGLTTKVGSKRSRVPIVLNVRGIKTKEAKLACFEILETSRERAVGWGGAFTQIKQHISPRGRGEGRKLAHLNFPPIPKPAAARSRGWVPTTPTTRGGVERKRASC
jgi:hypothetical protein